MVKNQRLCLLTDLDNTMIYSYKRDIGPDKVPVEPYQGRIVSYMTRLSYESLVYLKDRILFVPITTRSKAQYERIWFGGWCGSQEPDMPARPQEPCHGEAMAANRWVPPYALVSNGGTLLVEGKEDSEWKADSLKLIQAASCQLVAAEEVLKADPARSMEVRRVDDLFVFTKSQVPERTCHRLKDALDLSLIDVVYQGVKVYVVPKILNKGTAADRFLQYLERKKGEVPKQVICAGDSSFDLPFLWKGDVAFSPAEANLVARKPAEWRGRHMEACGILSDEIFSYLKGRGF